MSASHFEGIVRAVLRVVVPASVMLVLASPAAADFEQRCGELNQYCKCSEPLDNNDTLGQFHNPSDSKTYQCLGGGNTLNALSGFQPGAWEMVSAGDAGGLPSGINYVLKAKNLTGRMDDTNRNFTNQTYCSRHYFKFGSGMRNPGSSDDDIKGPRWEKPKGSPHPGVECSVATNGEMQCKAQYQGSTFGTSNKLALAPSSGQLVTLDDCKSSWCRFEICFDHNSSACAGNRLAWRSKFVQLSSGKTWQRGPECSPNSSSSAVSGDSSRVFSSRTDFLSNPSMWFSHAMVAIVPSDPSFWIGPAIEIENASGPPIPDPPVLLP